MFKGWTPDQIIQLVTLIIGGIGAITTTVMQSHGLRNSVPKETAIKMLETNPSTNVINTQGGEGTITETSTPKDDNTVM